jgi:hypothetical protein
MPLRSSYLILTIYAAAVFASPLATIVDEKIRGIHYMSHVVFTNKYNFPQTGEQFHPGHQAACVHDICM